MGVRWGEQRQVQAQTFPHTHSHASTFQHVHLWAHTHAMPSAHLEGEMGSAGEGAPDLSGGNGGMPACPLCTGAAGLSLPSADGARGGSCAKPAATAAAEGGAEHEARLEAARPAVGTGGVGRWGEDIPLLPGRGSSGVLGGVRVETASLVTARASSAVRCGGGDGACRPSGAVR